MLGNILIQYDSNNPYLNDSKADEKKRIKPNIIHTMLEQATDGNAAPEDAEREPGHHVGPPTGLIVAPADQ